MHIERPVSKMPIPPHAKKVFEGIIFNVWQWDQKMFDGSTEVFEKLSRPDTAVVIPVTPQGTILIADQEQPGMNAFTGVVGGRIDSGEDPLAAAKRELLEETGYETSEWELWDAYQPYAKIDWAIFMFIARGVRKTQNPHTDAGEKISLREVSFEELVALSQHPTFRDFEITQRILRARAEEGGLSKLRTLFLNK